MLYTQYTISNIKKKITLNYLKSAAMGFCSKGLTNEFERAVVNEPSVFDSLKFYCMFIRSVGLNVACNSFFFFSHIMSVSGFDVRSLFTVLSH